MMKYYSAVNINYTLNTERFPGVSRAPGVYVESQPSTQSAADGAVRWQRKEWPHGSATVSVVLIGVSR